MKLNNLSVFTIVSSIGEFAWGLIGPFYVIYVQKIGGSIESLGIAFGILLITQSLTSYFAGKYSDVFGRKPLLILSGYVTALIFFIYTLVQTVFQLYILQFIWGIVIAVDATASTAFLGDITQKSRRGTQVGKFKAIIGIFAGFSIILGGILVGKFGFKLIFYIGSLLLFTATTLLFLIKETVRKKK